MQRQRNNLSCTINNQGHKVSQEEKKKSSETKLKDM